MILTTLAAQSLSAMPIFLDGWMVYYNAQERSCIMEQPQPDRTTIRIGMNAAYPNNVFVVLTNPSWVSVTAGQRYAVSASIGRSTWQRDASGVVRGILLAFERNTFLNPFYEGGRLIVTREGRQLINMSWRARRAVDAVVSCIAGTADPFRN